MPTLTEGQLTFTFPDGSTASKYDDWSFYRNQFNGSFGGTKAVDMIHVDESQTWLIEIKDYRRHPRTKVIDLGDEIAFKVRDTLAGLVAAKCNANTADEKNTAREALKRNRFRVVLHLEQPRKHSKLFPQVVDPSLVFQKLKQRLKAVDAHPRVVDQRTLETRNDMNWTVKG